MTALTTWTVDRPGEALVDTRDVTTITDELAAVGIRFEQRPLADLPVGAGENAVLSAYADEVARLVDEGGFHVIDVAQLHPSDDSAWPATARGARAKFLAEHTHDEDEVRFFVHGSGIFYLHIGDRVHAVLCEAGDLISVPALTTHWFDMGATPDFTAIRLFRDSNGWVGTFTDSGISESFADFDELVSPR